MVRYAPPMYIQPNGENRKKKLKRFRKEENINIIKKIITEEKKQIRRENDMNECEGFLLPK